MLADLDQIRPNLATLKEYLNSRSVILSKKLFKSCVASGFAKCRWPSEMLTWSRTQRQPVCDAGLNLIVKLVDFDMSCTGSSPLYQRFR